MPAFKYGNPVFFDTVKSDLILEGLPAEDGDVRKAMGERAFNNINGGGEEGFQNLATTRANGMKEEFGNGVSTKILIYNASGYKMNLQSSGSFSGEWSNYSAPDFIEVGEWAVSFHQKKSLGAVGSEGYIIFDFPEWLGKLAIQWSTVWEGTNAAKIIMASTKEELRASTLSEDIMISPKGYARVDSVKASYRISDSTTSTLIVTITNE